MTKTMPMHLLKRSDLHSLDDTDLLNNSEEFDLVSQGEIVTLPTNVFIVISPFLRSVMRSILPCVRPTVMVPDVSDEAVSKLKTLVSHFHDHDYQKLLNFDDMRDLNELFDLLKIDTGYFEISIADQNSLEVQDDGEYFYLEEAEYGLESLRANVKDEPCDDDSNENHADSMVTNFESTSEIREEESEESNKIDQHDVADEGPLTCQFCDKKFRCEDIVSHLENHSEYYFEDGMLCPQQGCLKTFDYTRSGNRKPLKSARNFLIKTLKDHLRAKHTKTPSVSCSVCCKTFFSQMGLNYHKRQHDNNSKQYCDICMHFIGNTSFENHLAKCKRTKGSEKYKCQACGKAFKSPKNLEIHEGVHKSDKPFKCEDCPKAFVQKGNLKTHMIKKHR